MAQWRAYWIIDPTAEAGEVDIHKVKAGERKAIAVQGSLMSEGEFVEVDMLMNDGGGVSDDVWEPVIVQGEVMRFTSTYNHHLFEGPITLRLRKSVTQMPVGVSDFES